MNRSDLDTGGHLAHTQLNIYVAVPPRQNDSVRDKLSLILQTLVVPSSPQYSPPVCEMGWFGGEHLAILESFRDSLNNNKHDVGWSGAVLTHTFALPQ
jgi:hypothetical protein